MNKKKVIKVLEQQKAKILDKNHYNDETWVFQTASYIKDIFGEKSTEYDYISRFTFTVQVLNTTPKEEIGLLIQMKEDKVIKFINNCIETIKNKGIIKPTKMNFLNKLNNGILIAIITFAVPSLIGIGFYFGTEKINENNIELKAANKSIVKSYDSLEAIITNQSITIDTLSQNYDSLKNLLIQAKSIISDYNKSQLSATIKYSEPFPLFGGFVLVNAEKHFDNVKFTFEGDVNISKQPKMDYQKKEIEIEQGKRFYLKDNLNQIWIVNIMKIESFEVKIDLIKKTMP